MDRSTPDPAGARRGRPDAPTSLEIVDGWVRRPDIRRDALIALGMFLAALVLIAALRTGLLSTVAGASTVGGAIYTIRRSRRSGRAGQVKKGRVRQT